MSSEPELFQNPEYGPYLLAALICERVLQEKDGVLSAIRIIDRIIRNFYGPNPSSKMDPFPYDLTMLFVIKPGEFPGNHLLSIDPVKPTNERLPPIRRTILLEPPADRGANFVLNAVLPVDTAGMWRFEVRLDDRLVVQIPLNVMYLPQPSSPAL
jgi:hypothetical protein